MKLESTTYHYAIDAPNVRSGAKPGDIWPDLTKRHSTLVYRPDYLSFDVHVTHETHRVSLQNVRVSGFRILKDNTLSSHRVHESMFAGEYAPFVAKHIERTLAYHRA